MLTLTDDMVAVLSADNTSSWLLQALRSAIQRDPIQAANDAERLADLLTGRVEEQVFLGQWRPSGVAKRPSEFAFGLEFIAADYRYRPDSRPASTSSP